MIVVCRALLILATLAANGEPSARVPRLDAASVSNEPGNAYRDRARAAVRDVLATREFADLHSDPYAFWRRILEWIGGLFESLGNALRGLPPWLFWIVVGWMVLTTTAILGHLIYTLVKLIRGTSRAERTAAGRGKIAGELLGIQDLDFDKVYAEAGRLLVAGDWAAATRYFYVAAILWLDRQGAIVFKRSKTNCDYIAELTRGSRSSGSPRPGTPGRGAGGEGPSISRAPAPSSPALLPGVPGEKGAGVYNGSAALRNCSSRSSTAAGRRRAPLWTTFPPPSKACSMTVPSLARADRILLSIVLLVALLAALLHWLFVPEKTGTVVRMPSTFFNVPSGAKAGYDVLQRLDYPATRLRRRISRETLNGVGVLFVLRPEVGLAREEVAALKEWIDDGHALVVVPGDAPSFASKAALAGDDEYLDNWFEWNNVSPTNPTSGKFPMAELTPEPSKPDGHDRLTEGLNQLTVPRNRRFTIKKPFHGYTDKAPAGKVFWKDEWGAIGVEAKSGDGTIVALADEYPFTNVGVSEGDNGLLLANVARELSAKYPGDIAFDEYHLGMAERDVSEVAIAKLMLAGPWRWAVLQAALVGALALFAQAVRFGKPRDVVRKLRRQHREFAEAAGRLFEE